MDESRRAGLARLGLRVSLGVVFLWFGLDKFINPGFWTMWVPGVVHEGLEKLLQVDVFPSLLYLIGVYELVTGVALVLGLLVRYVAGVAAFFLGLIIITSGVSPVVRDIGLLGIAIYLALTERETGNHNSGWKLSYRINGRATTFLVVLLVVTVVSLTFIQAYPALNSFSNGEKSNDKGGKKQLLAIVSPAESEVLTSREIMVRIKILTNVAKLGANHVHIKLDGTIVDVIYLASQKDEVVSELYVSAGKHRLSVFLAYIDHTEFPSSSVSTNFTVNQ